MGKIYVGQESLEIQLDTSIDLTTASSLKIKYIKPDKTAGEWVGVLLGTTSVKKTFVDGADELDVAGNWIFWAWAEMSDGRVIPGEEYQRYVYTEGDV